MLGTADLIGATYEYFPGASHFGLVMGSDSWPQVAGSVLGSFGSSFNGSSAGSPSA